MSAQQLALKAPSTKLLLATETQRCLQPTIACAFGVPEAFFLQQLQFWLTTKPKWVDGVPWVYNTHDNWHKELPFFSAVTIRRAAKHLEQRGIVKTATLSRDKSNRTKWYTIDYDAFEQALADYTAAQPPTSSSDQNDQIIIRSNRPHLHVIKKATSCRTEIPAERSPQSDTPVATRKEEKPPDGEEEKRRQEKKDMPRPVIHHPLAALAEAENQRPHDDAALQRLEDLDEARRDRLRAQAMAQLYADGTKPAFMTEMLIKLTMLTLYHQEEQTRASPAEASGQEVRP
jgi:hypothetical protein